MALAADPGLRDSRLSRAEALARELEDQISSGTLATGERLGTKEDLRQHFNVAVATVNEAIKLLDGARQLLWSSAFSVIRPEALHPQRTIEQVDNFLKGCRFGQTERGSFVATILAPREMIRKPESARAA